MSLTKNTGNDQQIWSTVLLYEALITPDTLLFWSRVYKIMGKKRKRKEIGREDNDKKYQDDGIRTCLTETKSWSQLPPPLERHHSAQLVLLQDDHDDDGDDDDAVWYC